MHLQQDRRPLLLTGSIASDLPVRFSSLDIYLTHITLLALGHVS